jgi:hypothetical protein
VNTSIIIGAIALVLAGLLATGHAFGQESTQPSPFRETAHERLEQREAARRAAVTEQQKRKDEFARNCIKPGLTEPQPEACRSAYRRL